VAELLVLGESLIIELRRLLPFNGSWERASVHRLLELLYRTLPLVQLGPAICGLTLEGFQQLKRREVSQSNSWSPAEYSLHSSRDTEQSSRVQSFSGEYGIPASWLIGEQGKQLKSVSCYSLRPSSVHAATVNDAWRAMHAVRTLLGSKEDVWKLNAPNAALTLCRTAARKERSIIIGEGSTMSIVDVLPEETGSGTSDISHKGFGRVHFIVAVSG